jgi:hypothetical protein
VIRDELEVLDLSNLPPVSPQERTLWQPDGDAPHVGWQSLVAGETQTQRESVLRRVSGPPTGLESVHGVRKNRQSARLLAWGRFGVGSIALDAPFGVRGALWCGALRAKAPVRISV